MRTRGLTMTKAFPPSFPPDCMGVVVFMHPDYSDVRAYCSQKGCIVCLTRAHEAMGIPDVAARAEALERVRLNCFKQSVHCHPGDALLTVPTPVYETVINPPAPITAMIAGESGHTDTAVSVVCNYDSEAHTVSEVRDINDWCDVLTTAWYRELQR